MRRAWLLLPLSLLALPPAASASDGVLEINHTCATATGCFPGDGPGYPVQITQPGSYRLTSNLTVPASTSGIEVASGVDIELEGLERGAARHQLGAGVPTRHLSRAVGRRRGLLAAASRLVRPGLSAT